jgi:hypothetical protein
MLLSRKNKLGVSVMIGYVLLITFAIIMGGIVYRWMRSYVPTETLECPDGVSVLIRDINCTEDIDKWNLEIDLMNNGRFEINGYYIKYSDTEGEEIGRIPVTEIISGGKSAEGIVFFTGQDSVLGPGENIVSEFEIDTRAYLVEITPIRYEVIEGKTRLAICTNAKIKEKLTYP